MQADTLTISPVLEAGYTRWLERDLLPDRLIRLGIRRLFAARLRQEETGGAEAQAERLMRFIAQLRLSPIAIRPDAANEQHYEVPAEFYRYVLGPHLKYSCALWSDASGLEEAEMAMLDLTCHRARMKDGQDVLELGCGWGSLSLWLAARYPRVQIVALSNSHGQRAFIEAEAARRGLTNLTAETGDVIDFEFSDAQLAGGFDRVLSIEMFEHMKNYGLLLAKIARWMRDDAKLFVHIFAHRTLAYHFQVQDGSDWMSKYFFTGGTMPSEALLLHFQDDLRVTRQWWVSGTQYERTANQWLVALDAARDEVVPLFVGTYGAREAAVWFQRWRMFYMAVAELFGFAGGNEWGVGHYLFETRRAQRASNR